MDVLVIDVGGTHVKMKDSASGDVAAFDSGPDLTPASLVSGVRAHANGWRFDVVSLGIPGAVDARGPIAEPGNLGDGWTTFDFGHAFGKPVRIVNDAVMQALGAYDGGRMLFLGLGTGLGSALVTDFVVVPLELGRLPAGNGQTVADHVGREGLEAQGPERWREAVLRMTLALRDAFAADYVMLGGGNARLLDELPPGLRRGGNDDAFTGGVRLWQERVEPHEGDAPCVWRVVR